MPRDLIAYPETVQDEVSKSLEAAADYIEAHGFCGERAFAKNGSVCFVGAYYRVYGDKLGSLAWHAASPRIRKVIPIGPIAWAVNNPRATKGAVALLRAAANLK